MVFRDACVSARGTRDSIVRSLSCLHVSLVSVWSMITLRGPCSKDAVAVFAQVLLLYRSLCSVFALMSGARSSTMGASPAASPQKDKPSDTVGSKHSSYAQRLPKPAKTNNSVTDKDNEESYECAMCLIDGLQMDVSRAQPLSFEYQRRVAARKAQGDAVAGDEECFRNATTFATIDPEWVAALIAKKSDMTLDEVLAVKPEVEGRQQLFEAIHQCPLRQQLPECLKVKAVAKGFIDKRDVEVGTPLLFFKAKGGLLANGKLQWKSTPRYTFQDTKKDSGGRFDQITYVGNGDKVIVPPNAVFTTETEVAMSWSGWRANCQQDPMPKFFSITSLSEMGSGRTGPQC